MFLCGLPLATDRALIFPHLFSLISFIALSAALFCVCVSVVVSTPLNTVKSCNCYDDNDSSHDNEDMSATFNPKWPKIPNHDYNKALMMT